MNKEDKEKYLSNLKTSSWLIKAKNRVMNKENIEPKNKIKTAEEILHAAYKILEAKQDSSPDTVDSVLLEAMEEYANQFKPPAISSNEGETVEKSALIKYPFEKAMPLEPENFTLNGVKNWDLNEFERKAFIEGAQWQAAQYQHSYTEDKWIKVEDRLPEHGEDFNVVLDLEDGGEPVSGIMEFDGVNRIWLYPGTDVECLSVTHWQPLPAPPKK